MAELTLLYKYLDCNGIKVLENGTLRGSVPTKLNDPFEFMAGLLPLTEQEILSSIETEEVLIDEFWNRKRDKSESKQKFRAHMRQHPEIILQHLQQHPNIQYEVFEEVCKGRDDYRLLCFSLRNDGILMWAHYADHHKGFVLGFDKAPLDAGYSPDQRFPVEYRSARPCIGNILDLLRPGESEQLKMAVRTKSLEWAYEEEYRLLGVKRNEDDNDMLFEPLMLRQVIFGSRCLPKLEERIREILARPDYGHVRFSRAFLSNREFKIEIKDE
jgi:Protein of unknown function (DUF2971)